MGESISLATALDTAATGDIWLYRGDRINNRMMQLTTNSPVNHVAMAVALDDLPPLLFHTESKPSCDDVWTGTRHPGVQLQRLEESARVWGERWGQRLFVRQLTPALGREQEDELLRVINEYDGRRFPAGTGLARRYLRGRLRRRADPNEIFCAELIATAYQRMGLLGHTRPPNWYDPGRFWSGDRIGLDHGHSLSPEIEVTLD